MSKPIKSPRLLSLPLTARWRILGWIVLTTALVVLLIILSARSTFRAQVLHNANQAIVQEVEEFRTFASQAIDSKTRKPFTSITVLMERYLERQTPDWGEAFIAVTSNSVMVVDNAPNDAGERLAADHKLLNQLLQSKTNSGVLDTPDGQLRWGKSVVSAGAEQGALLVAEFVQGNLNRVRRNMTALFGIMIVGMLLTAVIAWVVAGQILAPINRFAELSSRVGPFDLSTRLPEIGRDELSQLAHNINAMLDRISSAQADQRHVLSETLRQVQAIALSLAQVRYNHSEGAEALKEPLTNLRRLAQDLSMLLKSGQPGYLQTRPVELGPLTHQIARKLQQSLPGRDWQVREVADAKVPLDEHRIIQAVQHLARNAMEQTREGDRIDMGSGIRQLPSGETMASLWVANSGMGLNMDEAKAIFETPVAVPGQAVHHPDDLDEERMPAMGMGLAVVKALAHAHGGYAWVASGPEQATIFGIDVPMFAVQAPARAENAQAAALDAMSQEK